jgi:arylamine N-acetyltransferase
MLALPEVYQRYLHLLGIDGVPSGLAGLKTVVRAHLCRVPFENVSKLLLFDRERVGRFSTLPEFLDGIERHDLGGTCYSCNPFLAELLRALGYDTDVLGADMAARLNCHTSLRVRVDTVAYHVDVGYGGPFREPIRLDRLPFEMTEGELRYAMDRNPQGEGYEMSVFSGPDRVHGYIVHDPPRARGFFAPSMHNSFLPEATFLNCVRICRFFEDYSAMLLDRGLRIHRGTETTRIELATAVEWESAFVDHLQMPRCPAREALNVLERITGNPLFDGRASSDGPSAAFALR